MDIVQTILGMCSGNMLGKMSSALGESEATTKLAASTAIPALLAGISQVASTPGGAQKVISAMNQLESNAGESAPGSTSMLEQGGSMLKSLFGGGTSGLTGAVSRFTGLGESGVSKLLAFLAPLIMGGVAKQFSGQAPNPSSLMNFFSGQKANISNAMPPGLSLSNVLGLSSATSSLQSGYHKAADTVSSAARSVSSAAQTGFRETERVASAGVKWLVPALVGLCLLAALLYFMLSNRTPPVSEVVQTPSAMPNVPDAGKVRSDISAAMSSVSESLSGIKDAASAEAALPKLREAEEKLGTARASLDKMPEPGRSGITQLVDSNLRPLINRMNDVLKIPGVGDKLRPVCDSIASEVGWMARAPASEYALVRD